LLPQLRWRVRRIGFGRGRLTKRKRRRVTPERLPDAWEGTGCDRCSLAGCTLSALDRSVVRRKRWTPARIRKAIALPKPVGAIDKAEEYTLGKRLPDLTPLDSLALREIAENADVLDVAQTAECGRTQATRWLLVPAPMWLIEALAVFEADPEDLEPNQDDERGEDDEPSVGWLAGSLQQGDAA
jgi:hypothetical protein